ncbi:MAG: putative hydrolases of HD superfamily [Parcubacteria bacterium C7867-006]|nr:MAG: putative hydrolases of HD superfamily [Parcubacteria bacterium C7867-006]
MKKSNKKSKSDYKNTANFLFEVGILSKTPRSGFHFLGTGDQSVAEHINRVCYIGYALAMMDGTVNISKVLEMCLFHDISETRISDLNYVHQKYVERKEEAAHRDIADSISFGEEIFGIIEEYEDRQSKESILVKDADNIEWIMALKEQVDQGNTRALKWAEHAVKRIKTENAKKIVNEIMKTDSNAWWFDNKKVAVSYKSKEKNKK